MSRLKERSVCRRHREVRPCAGAGSARYVALVSFAYNIDVGAACKSSVIRVINAGQTFDASGDEFP